MSLLAAVDLAEEMLQAARAKAGAAGCRVDFRRADAERLPFDDASFDLVVERHVLWTLPDPLGALAEWGRVLRSGGRLVLIEGDWRSAGHPDYAAIRAALPLYGGRPAAELAALLLTSGLVAPRVEPLMDGALWGATPERERHALQARKP